ncbi:MAG: tetratricopeptide repeat protein [Xenococcus sp. (in: cyanobacteria)]
MGGLGNAHCNLGHYQKAINYYQQWLNIAKETSDRNGEAKSLIGLGNAYNYLGKHYKAIEFLQKSLEIERDIGDLFGEGTSLGNLGITYYCLGQYERAIDLYQQSLDISQKIDDRFGEGFILNNLSKVYYDYGRFWKGYVVGNKARQIFDELNMSIEQKPSSHWLQSLIRYAQRGKLQLVLCFLFGLIAFPFALAWIIFLTLWRLTKRLFAR